jgi:hypothetical protein
VNPLCGSPDTAGRTTARQSFLDTDRLVPLFGMPARLESAEACRLGPVSDMWPRSGKRLLLIVPGAPV